MATLQNKFDEIAAKPYVVKVAYQNNVANFPLHLKEYKRQNPNKPKEWIEQRIDGVQVYQVPVWTNLAGQNFHKKVRIVEWTAGGEAEFAPDSEPDKLFQQEERQLTPFQQAVKDRVENLLANGTLLAVNQVRQFPDSNTVVISALIEDPQDPTKSKEITKSGKWDEQSDSWTLRDHTPSTSN